MGIHRHDLIETQSPPRGSMSKSGDDPQTNHSCPFSLDWDFLKAVPLAVLPLRPPVQYLLDSVPCLEGSIPFMVPWGRPASVLWAERAGRILCVKVTEVAGIVTAEDPSTSRLVHNRRNFTSWVEVQ